MLRPELSLMAPLTCCGLAVLLALLVGASGEAQGPGGESGEHTGPTGLGWGPEALPLLTAARTRSVSAENPTGAQGQGGMALPDPAEPRPVANARAADDLGQGWKVRPFLRVNAGETAMLMDVDGPGVIQRPGKTARPNDRREEKAGGRSRALRKENEPCPPRGAT